jgi:hypothetical protein
VAPPLAIGVSLPLWAYSMGTRACTPDSASTAPVKRSALDPPGRPTGDRAPPLTLNHNEWGREPSPTTSTTSPTGALDK